MLSLCFFVFRLFVRVRYFKKVYADDCLVIAAWFMVLASSVIWQLQQAPLYNSFKLSAGQIQPTANILAVQQSFLHANLAAIVLFLSCLWSVKISILLFFRRLGYNVRGLRIWWWSVMGITVLTWATCIGILQYPCLLGSADFIFSEFSYSVREHSNDTVKPNAEHRINKPLQETLSIFMQRQMLSPTP